MDRCLDLLRQAAALRRAGSLTETALRPLVETVWPELEAAEAALRALTDPYLAAAMLWRTLGLGFRGNPNHLRPLDDHGPRLAADLLAALRLHNRLRRDLPRFVAWPEAGLSSGELVGDGGWCELCGQCCCHMGTVPTPPPGVDYPAYWYHVLAGEAIPAQPYCPFLFQTRDAEAFFCAIHPLKPIACSRFGRADCQRGREGRRCLAPA